MFSQSRCGLCVGLEAQNAAPQTASEVWPVPGHWEILQLRRSSFRVGGVSGAALELELGTGAGTSSSGGLVLALLEAGISSRRSSSTLLRLIPPGAAGGLGTESASLRCNYV